MTTTTDRAAELREQVADAERLMAMAYGTPLFHAYVARANAAREELEGLS